MPSEQWQVKPIARKSNTYKMQARALREDFDKQLSNWIRNSPRPASSALAKNFQRETASMHKWARTPQ
jgi:hypothetical protein